VYRSAALGAALLALALLIVRYPGDAFQAALQGLSIWWNLIFPGLLPFLALSELLLAFGVVHAVGVLLEPVMRRVFRLPGCAGWAAALGWTSGFPAGAGAAARLHQEGALTDRECQRLLALSHMPSPMLMLIVVGAGFLHRPEFGIAIAAAVWLSALTAGWLLARLDRTGGASDAVRMAGKGRNMLTEAAAAMRAARRRDGRGFGQAMGDSIALCVQRLMALGGLIILGSVLIRLLRLVLPELLHIAAFPGIYEAHLGAFAAAGLFERFGAPAGAALTASVLSWTGLAGLLASHGMAASAKLRFLPLAAAKLLHAGLAFLITVLVWKPLAWLGGVGSGETAAVFRQLAEPAVSTGRLPLLWQAIPFGAAALTFSLLLMLTASLLMAARRPGR
jgi:sporulation integral membrane protein YlbJ